VNDSFNYVAVLVSIVVGLGVTRVLSQISEGIQAGSRQQTYWIHTIWLINAFSILFPVSQISYTTIQLLKLG